jgi:ornithine carbamoyltransferase
MKSKRDFLSIIDITQKEFLAIVHIAKTQKQALKKIGHNRPVLKGKTLIMIYEKPSLRTHASFDIGMYQLGGHTIYFGPEHIGLGKREPIEHAAKVLCRMGDVIMARVFSHQTVTKLATYSSVPVINGLSDLEHPCQILADIMTIHEHKKRLKGLTIAYVGDCENNVTHSLALASGLLGMHFIAAGPNGYSMNHKIVETSKELAALSGGSIRETTDPSVAVAGADVVYTDTWISMGDEKTKAKRLRVLRPYQVNASLMKGAKPDAIFMHDMPAYIGNEVTKDVFDSPQSVVYDQAENRLHAQKGLLVFLLSHIS